MAQSRPVRTPRLCGLRALSLILMLVLSVALNAPVARAQAPVEPVPVEPAALVVPSTVAGVLAGEIHTCAMLADSTVRCWGSNAAGQLGDGTTITPRTLPVGVVGIRGVRALAAGSNHTCALLDTSRVVCWGHNGLGQLGDGTNSNRATPVAVSSLEDVVAIGAGYNHTCAVTSAGSVHCWGLNQNGQLGDGSTVNRNTPVNVSQLSGVTAVAGGGAHSCALLATGGVMCWGFNGFGSLGDGTTDDRHVPVAVQDNTTGTALAGVTAIAVGQYHGCARQSTGSVRCWGYNSDGQLGDGTTTTRTKAVAVSGLTHGAVALAAGRSHSCAAAPWGSVSCWGANAYGQLGDGSKTTRLLPVAVAGLGGPVLALALGGLHTCALLGNGRVQCWGNNGSGRLGIGSTVDQPLPVYVRLEQTCNRLETAATGNGEAPLASPAQGNGCPSGHYQAGQAVSRLADPAANQRVQGWSSPVAGTAGIPTGMLVMPAADTVVTVSYEACYDLTRSHSALGSDPQAAPAASLGCLANRYAAGERLTLVAMPGEGQRVHAWSGTDAVPATASQVNTLTMPDADQSVSVAYEACHTLSVSVVGAGKVSEPTPLASAGCALAASYAIGEVVQLTAVPQAGYVFVAWGGSLSGNQNPKVVTVGGPLSVTAIFAKQSPQYRIYLPAIQRK